MWWRNYSQTLSQKDKFGHISGSTVYTFILLVLLYAKLRAIEIN